MVLIATFNNVSAISCRSVLLVEEGSRSILRKLPIWRKSPTNFFSDNVAYCSGDRHWLHRLL